jgi:hypothetical protein
MSVQTMSVDEVLVDLMSVDQMSWCRKIQTITDEALEWKKCKFFFIFFEKRTRTPITILSITSKANFTKLFGAI